MFCKKRCSKKFRKIHRKLPAPTRPEASNFIKIEALALVFSYEFCEISKNTFLTEDVLATASIFNGYFIYTFTFTTFIWHFTAQKMKLFIMDLFGKCEQICRKPGIRSYLLKKSLLENVIFLWSVYLFIFSPNVFWKMYF